MGHKPPRLGGGDLSCDCLPTSLYKDDLLSLWKTCTFSDMFRPYNLYHQGWELPQELPECFQCHHCNSSPFPSSVQDYRGPHSRMGLLGHLPQRYLLRVLALHSRPCQRQRGKVSKLCCLIYGLWQEKLSLLQS